MMSLLSRKLSLPLTPFPLIYDFLVSYRLISFLAMRETGQKLQGKMLIVKGSKYLGNSLGHGKPGAKEMLDMGRSN